MDHASYLVDLVNDNGKVVSTKTRQEIQKETDLYHTVFIILATPDKKLILSKIPFRKDLPNLYSGLLGPTVSTIRRHGETTDEASLRGVKRELYIDDLSLNKLGEYYFVLLDGHRKFMSIYFGVHALPSDYSHADINSLQTFTHNELVEALKTRSDAFAPTFIAIWQKYNKDLF